MRKACSLLLLFLSFSSIHWNYNLSEALQQASTQNKYVLLNFSGSDWCGPCIRMHKEIFANEAFEKFANEALVMVNADFPRQKKNQLSAEQQKRNDTMADTYNKKGSFPYTVLLNPNGKVVKEWEGYPNETCQEMIIAISKTIDADKHK